MTYFGPALKGGQQSAQQMAEKKKAKIYERETVERGRIKNTLIQKKREIRQMDLKLD